MCRWCALRRRSLSIVGAAISALRAGPGFSLLGTSLLTEGGGLGLWFASGGGRAAGTVDQIINGRPPPCSLSTRHWRYWFPRLLPVTAVASLTSAYNFPASLALSFAGGSSGIVTCEAVSHTKGVERLPGHDLTSQPEEQRQHYPHKQQHCTLFVSVASSVFVLRYLGTSLSYMGCQDITYLSLLSRSSGEKSSVNPPPPTKPSR